MSLFATKLSFSPRDTSGKASETEKRFPEKLNSKLPSLIEFFVLRHFNNSKFYSGGGY